jgi:predicted alpha/beta-hydrolase family hydrolase
MSFEAFVADHIPCRRYGEGATTLVLAHGAGAGQAHPVMVRYAEGLAARGLRIVTFDFRYMAAKRGAPDRMPILEQSYRAVVAAVRPRGRLAIGGRSMGGRVASMIAASDPRICDALVFLGYPLHPPKQPEKLRVAHLPRIEAPMLFVQGERDLFGTPLELASIVETLPRAKLMIVNGGDHSLAVPKRVRPQAEVDADVWDAIVTFVGA